MNSSQNTPPVLTKKNTRSETTVLDIEDFASSLSAIAWFTKLGESSKWDVGCIRIHDWNEWRGPEDNANESLNTQYQAIYDWFKISNTPQLSELFNTTLANVTKLASRNVPDYDPEQDPWHAPSQCVNEAAYCAGLVACNLYMNIPVHEDLQEIWAWFAGGHWPCGFVDDAKTHNRVALLVY